MDRQPKTPALTITEAEHFWADGLDARQPAPGEENQPETSTTESVGIDLPGVWSARPEISLDCTGRESAAAVGSEVATDPACGVVVSLDDRLRASLQRIGGTAEECDQETPEERRDRLFGQLAFAAHRLAKAQIEPAEAEYANPAFCTECLQDERNGAIAHERGCWTGHVLQVIAELIATVQAAPEEEGGAA